MCPLSPRRIIVPRLAIDRSCATQTMDEATIKTSIENQKWDEGDNLFKIKAPTKP